MYKIYIPIKLRPNNLLIDIDNLFGSIPLIFYRYEEYIVSLQYAPMFTKTKPK